MGWLDGYVDEIYAPPAIVCPADGKDCDCDMPRDDCGRKPTASGEGELLSAIDERSMVLLGLLDRFERAAMAYERLGKVGRDDTKSRAMRKDAMAELAAARLAIFAHARATI